MYSNGQGFYLTLPSESSKDLFPENNASEYSVRLPQWIHLKGEWEIGLHSILKIIIPLVYSFICRTFDTVRIVTDSTCDVLKVPEYRRFLSS